MLYVLLMHTKNVSVKGKSPVFVVIFLVNSVLSYQTRSFLLNSYIILRLCEADEWQNKLFRIEGKIPTCQESIWLNLVCVTKENCSFFKESCHLECDRHGFFWQYEF